MEVFTCSLAKYVLQGGRVVVKKNRRWLFIAETRVRCEGLSVWDLCWRVWYWHTLLPLPFGFPLSVPIPLVLHINFLVVGGLTAGPFWELILLDRF